MNYSDLTSFSVTMMANDGNWIRGIILAGSMVCQLFSGQ